MQLLRTQLFVRSFLMLACAALPEQSAYAFPQARTLVPLKKPAATSRALPLLPPKVVAELPQPSVDPDTPQIGTTDGAATTPEDTSAAEKQNRLRALQITLSLLLLLMQVKLSSAVLEELADPNLRVFGRVCVLLHLLKYLVQVAVLVSRAQFFYVTTNLFIRLVLEAKDCLVRAIAPATLEWNFGVIIEFLDE